MTAEKKGLSSNVWGGEEEKTANDVTAHKQKAKRGGKAGAANYDTEKVEEAMVADGGWGMGGGGGGVGGVLRGGKGVGRGGS